MKSKILKTSKQQDGGILVGTTALQTNELLVCTYQTHSQGHYERPVVHSLMVIYLYLINTDELTACVIGKLC